MNDFNQSHSKIALIGSTGLIGLHFLESIRENDFIENIEISGDSSPDLEVDEHLAEWNEILDTILI